MRCGRRFTRRLLLASIAAAAVPLAIAGWIALPLPPDLAAPGAIPSLVIEDRHGLTLRTTRAADGSRGGWVPLAEVDPGILQAFLAAEDHRFFQHPGIDPRAVARAARDNLRARRIVSGASTISMQTARLLRPAPRTWRGKFVQLLWALRLEAHLDKARILEQYLNRVPLGQGAVGVAAGASLYFGADARHLSLGQAALLAALAHAPSRDNPLVDPARARAQRERVLRRMAELGYAGPEALARAAAEPVMREDAATVFLAPHFTTRLLQVAAEGGGEVPGVLGTFTGSGPSPGAGSSTNSGAAAIPGAPTGTWRTTLDLDLQRALEAEVRHTVALLYDRNVRHAAAVVLDNPSGGILAWVGSPDFWADAAGQVDMVTSPRQPGSALKPFLYGLAFDRGYTAATIIPDIPSTYQTTTGPYQPRNYDRRYRGPVRARVALASSFNVPAVELTNQIGTGALLNTLRAAGFSSLSRSADHYGLGLALGNGEVTLLELANGFRGIANGGVWTPVRWLEKPGADRGTGSGSGTVVTNRTASAHPDGERRFISTGTAALVLDILNDPIARTPGFGAETPLDFNFPAAAKTGTSRHFTDNWAVVTTERFTVAVWVGNFSGQPMQGVSGITGAGPLVYRATLETARRYPPGHLPSPAQAGATATPICILSGLLATPACPSMIEWFVPGTEPVRPDDWQRGGHTILPPEYAEWAAALDPAPGPAADAILAANGSITGAESRNRPSASGEGPRNPAPDRAASEPHRILSPLDRDIYEIPVGMDPRYATIPLIAGADAAGVRWSVDGQPILTARWQLTAGEHLIRAEWAGGAVDSVRITVR